MNTNCNRDPLTCPCDYHSGRIEQEPVDLATCSPREFAKRLDAAFPVPTDETYDAVAAAVGIPSRVLFNMPKPHIPGFGPRPESVAPFGLRFADSEPERWRHPGESDADFSARLEKAISTQIPALTLSEDRHAEKVARLAAGYSSGTCVFSSADAQEGFTPLDPTKPPVTARPGILIDDEPEPVASPIMALVARWAAGIALVGAGAAVMYAEGLRQAMPGVGFAVGLSMLVGAVLLTVGRGRC